MAEDSLRRGVRWQPPAREPEVTKLPARADSDEPDASGACAQVLRLLGSGAEYEAGKAHTQDGAGVGPLKERTYSRGRGIRLL